MLNIEVNVKPAITALVVPCIKSLDGCVIFPRVATSPAGVAADQVVATLISSMIKVPGVLVVLSCLKNIL